MKKYSIEVKWSIVFFAAIILWTVFEKSIGLHNERIDRHVVLTNFFAIPAIIIYTLALINKRTQNGGKLSWKEGFTSGLIIGIIVSLLSPLSQYLTHTYISPEYFPNVIELTVNSSKLTREEAEEYFNLASYIKQSMVGAIIMGAITSAICALFIKRK